MADPADTETSEAPAAAPGGHGSHGGQGAHGSHGDDGWFDKPKNMRLFLWSLYAACALTAVADFIIHKHPHFAIEETPVFYGWYGFVCFAGIVLIGQHLRKLLARPEDYYDG
ncbi:MAG: hypothetical protein AAGH48_08860 [Pseudomonadota bacterium]